MQETLGNRDTILSYLRELTRDLQSGELFLNNGEVNAKIYMNRGKIIWAFATGQEESFQSILIKENKIPKSDLIAGINKSRDAGRRNLDDILLDLGVEDADERRSIVLRHTKAALGVVLDWGYCAAQLSKRADATEPLSGFDLEELVPEDAIESTETLKLQLEGDDEEDDDNGSDMELAALDGPPVVTDSQLLKPTSAPGEELNRPLPVSQPAEPEVSDIPGVLTKLQLEIPNFLAAMVIDCATGMPIASVADVDDLDVEVASAFYRDLMKSGYDAFEALGKAAAVEGYPIQEILITGAEDYVLLRTLNDGAHILYALIDSDSNPGMARVVMRRYVEKLSSFLT